jgi:hypothetical protein
MPGGHGRRGRAPAGHSFRAAVAPQPSTTHAPPGALWQPGPHPSAALAAPNIEKLPANRTATKRFLNVTSMVGAAYPRSDKLTAPLKVDPLSLVREQLTQPGREVWDDRAVEPDIFGTAVEGA